MWVQWLIVVLSPPLQEQLRCGISSKERELPQYHYSKSLCLCCWLIVNVTLIKCINFVLSQVFKPIFASAKMCINPNAELELKGPKANLHLEVQNIAIEMTKAQVTLEGASWWWQQGKVINDWPIIYCPSSTRLCWNFSSRWITWWRMPPIGSSGLRSPSTVMPNSGKWCSNPKVRRDKSKVCHATLCVCLNLTLNVSLYVGLN